MSEIMCTLRRLLVGSASRRPTVVPSCLGEQSCNCRRVGIHLMIIDAHSLSLARAAEGEI